MTNRLALKVRRWTLEVRRSSFSPLYLSVYNHDPIFMKNFIAEVRPAVLVTVALAVPQ
jgi:hypothetical protein